MNHLSKNRALEKKMKMCKVYDDNNDSDGQRTNCDQKSSHEQSAQVSEETVHDLTRINGKNVIRGLCANYTCG